MPATSQHPHLHQRAALRAYLGLMIVTACCFGMEYAPQPMYNTISRALGVSRTSIGWLVGVFMLSLTLSPLFVGLLLSRAGIRRAVLVSSVILGASGTGVDIYVPKSMLEEAKSLIEGVENDEEL